MIHPTFSEHIAPVIYKSCTPCHRPRSAAPFNLITYADVKRHAKTIALAVEAKAMPPWPADPTYSHFRDEKYLSEDEIQLIRQWVDEDCPEGDFSKLPSIPEFPDHSTFGKPGLILNMDHPYLIKGNNKDNFVMMKIPYELKQDTFIRAIEIVPGNTKVVHHINAHLVQYKEGAKTDLSKGEKFVDTEVYDKLRAFQKLDLQNDDGTYPLLTPSVTNFLPGAETTFYPEGIGGYCVKKNGILLLDNIHYGPSPVDTTDHTSFNIFFSAAPPLRPTGEFILGTSGISKTEPPLIIKPNTIQTFRTQYVVPEDLSILTINPHMHLLGKSFLAYAIKPDGDTIHLIRINQWDFRWQYFYTFKKILKLPKRTIIHVEGVYDNTVNNPLNPFHPPQIISEREGSMRTTDEMFQFIVTYMPYQVGDENISLEVSQQSAKYKKTIQ
ncbi:MAG: hypothetical protein NT126_11310 [Bacteroidetes bacterium]|nr:hypothetical protein [Bacteroidota bacterium]